MLASARFHATAMPKDHYQLLAQYNRWMNEKLYAVCAELSDAERKRDLGAFFGSLHRTLNHLLFGDLAWMGRFTNRPFQAPDMGADLYEEFDALRAERQRMDAGIEAWAERLDPEWLSAPFTYTSGVDGNTRTLPAWVLVSHMFNHQTHHRGQASTLIHQLGHDPGITDIPWLPALYD